MPSTRYDADAGAAGAPIEGARVHTGSLDATGMRIGIVVSRFNDIISTRLLDGAVEALRDHGRRAVTSTWCGFPARSRSRSRRASSRSSAAVDAVVCLGAVIRGDTAHFDYVAGEAAQGIASVHATTGVPATFGVLTVDTVEQATDRAGGKHGNKGAEAAVTAIEMVSLLRELRAAADGRAARGFMSAAARVVSLLPSATEILFAIGAGDRVVGVTHECDHPDAARHLPAGHVEPARDRRNGSGRHRSPHSRGASRRVEHLPARRSSARATRTRSHRHPGAVRRLRGRIQRGAASGAPPARRRSRPVARTALGGGDLRVGGGGRRGHRVYRRGDSHRRVNANAGRGNRRPRLAGAAAAGGLHRMDRPAHGRWPLGARDGPSCGRSRRPR